MKRLVLIGGGHAHLFVLRQLAKSGRRDVEVTLISPDVWQYYSGMLPGWVAGLYRLEECRVDLRPLATAAGASFIQQAIVGMDADQRCVCLADGRHVHYDLLSLDIGSETDCVWLFGLGERLIPVKPFAEFQIAWLKVIEDARVNRNYHLLVAGGGAAGVELAQAAHHTLAQINSTAKVTLVAGNSGLLPGYTDAVQQRVLRALQRNNIELIQQRAVGVEDGVLLGDGRHLAADKVIATTGARAAVWLALSKLSLDAHGYIAVDAYHRSLSHPEVFAAGDICSRSDVALARSGVHAVRAGPVLAENILATLDEQKLREFRPRRNTLYLLSCGGRYAVASWGRWSAEGRWVWRWKDWIDLRFIRRITAAPPHQEVG